MSDVRVLVVGTTADYIDLIRQRYPGRALFVTDIEEREAHPDPVSDVSDEVVCDLRQAASVADCVNDHLARHNQSVSGIACYDCESLSVAAVLARHFGKQFVSERAAALARNKFETKRAWLAAGVPCPKTDLVHTMWDALRFLDEGNGPIVLKPLSGSGSELTFHCVDRSDATQAYHLIRAGLDAHWNDRLYPSAADGDPSTNTRRVIAAEEFVEGREFSCDFVLENDRVTIIRVARKVRGAGLPFGTTLAYQVPARLPGGLTDEVLSQHLKRAAEAMGMERAFCMVDFIIRDDVPVFLELTPRPGGDCLPPLIRQACGVDMLGLELDFAEQKPLHIPPVSEWHTMIGVRMFADRPGRIVRQDTSAIEADARVKEVYLKRSIGHAVELPPDDYDSWLLGHIIFDANGSASIENQCHDLIAKLKVEMENSGEESTEAAGRDAFPSARAADSGA